LEGEKIAKFWLVCSWVRGCIGTLVDVIALYCSLQMVDEVFRLICGVTCDQCANHVTFLCVATSVFKC